MNKWSEKYSKSILKMEFLLNIMICQFEFETSNQHCNLKFRTYMNSWVEFFPKFNSRGGWNENALAGKFLEKLISGGDVY